MLILWPRIKPCINLLVIKVLDFLRLIMFFKFDWLVFFQVIKIESQPADEARWDFSYAHSEILDTVLIISFWYDCNQLKSSLHPTPGVLNLLSISVIYGCRGGVGSLNCLHPCYFMIINMLRGCGVECRQKCSW